MAADLNPVPQIAHYRAQILGVLFLVLLLGSGAYAVARVVDQRADLRQTRSTLAGTRRDLAREQNRGKSVKDRLASTEIALGKTQGELDATRTSLGNTQAVTVTQSADITALKQCIDGVTRAIISSSNGNPGESTNTLNSVRAQCDRAHAIV